MFDKCCFAKAQPQMEATNQGCLLSTVSYLFILSRDFQTEQQSKETYNGCIILKNIVFYYLNRLN